MEGAQKDVAAPKASSSAYGVFFRGGDEQKNNWESRIPSKRFLREAVFSFLSVCHWCPTIISPNRKKNLYFHTIVVYYSEHKYIS